MGFLCWDILIADAGNLGFSHMGARYHLANWNGTDECLSLVKWANSYQALCPVLLQTSFVNEYLG